MDEVEVGEKVVGLERPAGEPLWGGGFLGLVLLPVWVVSWRRKEERRDGGWGDCDRVGVWMVCVVVVGGVMERRGGLPGLDVLAGCRVEGVDASIRPQSREQLVDVAEPCLGVLIACFTRVGAWKEFREEEEDSTRTITKFEQGKGGQN